jgi:hypothetical protein
MVFKMLSILTLAASLFYTSAYELTNSLMAELTWRNFAHKLHITDNEYLNQFPIFLVDEETAKISAQRMKIEGL